MSVVQQRLDPSVFRLPVERMRDGYYSDQYFNLTRDLLVAEGRRPRVLMQIFQKEQSILGGVDEAVAVLKQCAGRRLPDGDWEDGWEELVVATRDWHPPDHGSFADQGGPWPVHCVAGTPGAELHHALDPTPIDQVIDKGQDPGTEGYSGFEGTQLAEILRVHDVDHVTVVGLATDYCVKNTALDALREGFSVTVDSTATRGVDVEPGDSERALDELRAAGASVA